MSALGSHLLSRTKSVPAELLTAQRSPSAAPGFAGAPQSPHPLEGHPEQGFPHSLRWSPPRNWGLTSAGAGLVLSKCQREGTQNSSLGCQCFCYTLKEFLKKNCGVKYICGCYLPELLMNKLHFLCLNYKLL